LSRVGASFKHRTNATIVLMVEPGALSWVDLPLIKGVAAEAQEHFIELSAVTPDGVAGTIMTAVGIPTATLPLGATSPETAVPATT
jgi:hypothetical protein